MKNINNLLKTFAAILFATLFLSACKKEDPIIPNEEEVITTMTYTLTPVGGGSGVVFYFQDLDGDGGNNPIITNGNLAANTSYNGVLTLLNETETPAGDITSEVKKEGIEHQFFFIIEGAASSNATVNYNDTDANGNPLGLSTTFITTDVSNGRLTIVLRHSPTKPNDGSLLGAGGETDIEVTFDLIIE